MADRPPREGDGHARGRGPRPDKPGRPFKPASERGRPEGWRGQPRATADTAGSAISGPAAAVRTPGALAAVAEQVIRVPAAVTGGPGGRPPEGGNAGYRPSPGGYRSGGYPSPGGGEWGSGQGRPGGPGQAEHGPDTRSSGRPAGPARSVPRRARASTDPRRRTSDVRQDEVATVHRGRVSTGSEGRRARPASTRGGTGHGRDRPGRPPSREFQSRDCFPTATVRLRRSVTRRERGGASDRSPSRPPAAPSGIAVGPATDGQVATARDGHLVRDVLSARAMPVARPGRCRPRPDRRGSPVGRPPWPRSDRTRFVAAAGAIAPGARPTRP